MPFASLHAKIVRILFIAAIVVSSVGFFPTNAHAAAGGTIQPVVGGQVAQIPKTEEVKLQGCFNLFDPPFINLEACVAEGAQFVMRVSGLFLWGAGWFMDQSITATINSKAFFERVPVVTIGWKVIRDIANIGFIFALLWIAISTIIGTLHGDIKRMLVKIIVFALLVNFSLFITRAVFDASNIITVHFYDLMTLDKPDGTRSSLSATFMKGLKLGTLYNTDKIGTVNPTDPAFAGNPPEAIAAFNRQLSGESAINVKNILLISLGGTVVILVAAFVFFATAFMFLGRAVGIMLLMVLSPLAFVGAILPNFSEKTGQFWHKLIGWSFFAPAYMVIAYIVARTINDPAFSDFTSKMAFSAAFSSGNGFAIVINYFIIIFLLLSALKIALGIADNKYITGFGVGLANTVRGYIGTGVRKGGGLYARQVLKGENRLGKAIASVIPIRYTSEGKLKGGWTGGKPVSLRELDEKVGESKFGNTAFGETLRKNTTHTLVNLNLGGKSAEQSFLDDKRRESAIEKIGERDRIFASIKAARTLTDPNERVSKIENEMAKLSPDDFVHYMPETDFHEPEIMRYATGAQMKALMEKGGSERHLSIQELEAARDAHFQFLTDRLEELEKKVETEFKPAYKRWEKGEIDPKTSQVQKRPDIESLHAQGDEYYEWLRNLSTDELSLMQTSKKNFFNRPLLIEAMRWGQIKNVLADARFPRTIRDNLRTLKDYRGRNAMLLDLGIDLSLPETEQEKLRSERKKMMVKANGDWEKFSDAVLNSITDPQQKAAEKALLEKRHMAGREAMKAHFLNRTADEIGSMRGGLRKYVETIRNMNSGHMSAIKAAQKDEGDNLPIVQVILRDFWNGEITDANLNSLKWMLTDRTGKTFYNGPLEDRETGQPVLDKKGRPIRWPDEQTFNAFVQKVKELKEKQRLNAGISDDVPEPNPQPGASLTSGPASPAGPSPTRGSGATGGNPPGSAPTPTATLRNQPPPPGFNLRS